MKSGKKPENKMEEIKEFQELECLRRKEEMFPKGSCVAAIQQ